MAQNTCGNYDKQTGKFLAAIAQNIGALPETVMQGWIQNPLALQNFLGGLDQNVIEHPKKAVIQPWRQIIIGGKTSDELLAELDEIGALGTESYETEIRALVRDPTFCTLPTPHRVNLAKMKIGQFGFVKEPPVSAMLSRARRLGLTWHPSLALNLRLEYFDQNMDKDGDVWTPMKPIMGISQPAIFGMDVGDDNQRYVWTTESTDETDLKTRRFALHGSVVFIIGQPEPIA